MTEKIKILMIKKGITQKELADKLEVAQPTLSKKFKLDDWRESDLIHKYADASLKVVLLLTMKEYRIALWKIKIATKLFLYLTI